MLRWIAALLLSCVPLASSAGQDPMDCSIGSLERTFGKSQWLVHACIDGRSVVIVAAAGNPAAPFVFIMFPEGDSYRLYGEGTGDKSSTKPAYDELAASLTPTFVQALHTQAVESAESDTADDGT